MFEPGTQVGRYEIQRRLGRGGMGSVYVAHDPVLGRMVAVKVFAGDLDLPDARDRFSREARAAAALSHPNIVTVYDFGEYDWQPFIVMEYVAGETLAGIIRRKAPVTIADKLRWMEELCAGVGYAHQMQLVHRDIKPSNLIIDRSGRLKILDFGIARILGLPSNTGVIMGTPGYMAPEQITGDPVDHRADQFSIGVVFYELLAYAEAFPGDTLPMITQRILNEEPRPLGPLAPDAPAELVAIIQRSLRKSPAERFPDSESLRAAIARIRRDASNQAAWNLNTTPFGHDTPTAPSTAARGTGSARRRQDDAVGVAQLTPPPDPRRTDREALARRRTQQLEAALSQARTLFSQGQLEEALDACQQALTYDETHVGALQLEEEVETAIRGRAIAAVSPVPPETLETLWHNLDERPSEVVTQLDPALRSPQPSAGAAERTTPRQPKSTPDATAPAPPRRTPAPMTVPTVSTTPLPAAPPQDVSAEVPTVQSSVPRPAAPAGSETAKKSAPAPTRPAIEPLIARVVAQSKIVTDSAKSIAGAVSRDRRTLAIVSISLVVVIVAVAAMMMLNTPAASGVVVIDAVPWGTITAIETEGGEPLALPPSASTPLSLSLPAGAYQVVVTGPPPALTTQRVTVRIQQDATTVAPIVRFETLTPEDYFERYLEAPAALSLDAGGAPAETTPVTPAQSLPETSAATGSKP